MYMSIFYHFFLSLIQILFLIKILHLFDILFLKEPIIRLTKVKIAIGIITITITGANAIKRKQSSTLSFLITGFLLVSIIKPDTNQIVITIIDNINPKLPSYEGLIKLKYININPNSKYELINNK